MSNDAEIYLRQGFGRRLGVGQSPALLIIDFVNGFADPEVFGGGNILDAINHTAELLHVARKQALPVVFTTNVYATDGCENGAFVRKVPELANIHPGSYGARIVDALAPGEGERIIEKRYASAFFGTDLASWLNYRQIDTTIITGCTTSGCVRATAVDAISYGFNPIIPKECVGDRATGPHEANLFDMDQKYADVMALPEVLQVLMKPAKGFHVA